MSKDSWNRVFAAVITGCVVIGTVVLIAVASQKDRVPKITKSWCEGSTKVMTFDNGQAAVTFNPYDCPATTLPGNYGG